MITQITSSRARSIKNEEDFVNANLGDSVKVMVTESEEPRWMVYEGSFFCAGTVLIKEESFIEQNNKTIHSWRCPREYLQFNDSLKNNLGIGVIVVNNALKHLEIYTVEHPLYEKAKQKLLSVSLWRQG